VIRLVIVEPVHLTDLLNHCLNDLIGSVRREFSIAGLGCSESLTNPMRVLNRMLKMAVFVLN
jgi:hypothetical protein